MIVFYFADTVCFLACGSQEIFPCILVLYKRILYVNTLVTHFTASCYYQKHMGPLKVMTKYHCFTCKSVSMQNYFGGLQKKRN